MHKIICISDTHGMHDKVQVPDGDILIHAGDVSMLGSEKEIISFLDWFDDLPHTYKIMISGNHDFFFDTTWHPRTVKGERRWQNLPVTTKQDVEDILSRYPDITYLENTGCVIEGRNFWGSPVSPWFHDWAFNRYRPEIEKYWKMIPDDTNILITHTPPFEILDTVKGSNMKVGCEQLQKRILELDHLDLHVFGHIHEESGIRKVSQTDTIFVNASILNEHYKVVNQPRIINV